MTINVVIVVPDGVVVACDSMATSTAQVVSQQGPTIPVPRNSTPLATKLFYVDDYAVTFFGASSLNGRTLFNHVMNYRAKVHRPEWNMERVSKEISEILSTAVKSDPQIKGITNKLTLIVGFQICGYNEGDLDFGRQCLNQITADGNVSISQSLSQYALYVSGDQRVVQKLFGQNPNQPIEGPNFNSMTLADAIDYARFLVDATSDYHRFAEMVPTVGGHTDVAVITKWIGFRFVDRKKLLGDETARLNIGKISHEIRRLRAELPIAASSKQVPVDEQPIEGDDENAD